VTNNKEIDMETRIKNIENVIFDGEQHLGEALNITYVTLQESLLAVGDFGHDLSALASELMTAIGNLIPDEYTAARAAASAPPDLKLVDEDIDIA
jgi:hypothetical protein